MAGHEEIKKIKFLMLGFAMKQAVKKEKITNLNYWTQNLEGGDNLLEDIILTRVVYGIGHIAVGIHD